ncbi:MAG: hypothetical protein JWN77_1618 [Frankiales bacterium]|jgi:PAS domain S-box-containing protein|nr:hypothetical protein [Frankiales bacterium]
MAAEATRPQSEQVAGSADPTWAEALVALATADVPVAELHQLAVDTLLEQLDVHGAAVRVGEQVVAGAEGSGRCRDVHVDASTTLRVWPSGDEGAQEYADQVARLLASALDRAATVERLRQRERHFVAAQRISHVGSYDFDIGANTNDWSDQLYRIYGCEPGAFMATYERFLEMVHPDDREMIVGVHQQALATLSPYQMEERIVWPDGQVRTLASWGEVVPDGNGVPARMVGICWDITQQKEDRAALQRSSERFSQLIESAPDVVLVVDEAGVVLRANARLADVLGVPPEEALGRPVAELVPAGLVAGEVTALHRDGTLVPADVSASVVELDAQPVTVAFLRDATSRKEHERLALRVHDGEVRRRHALEINDNVVQGLASVLYLLELDRSSSAQAAARQTLDAARTMMSDLLATAGDAFVPGGLVRERRPATLLTEPPPAPVAAPADALRVLLADDAPDIRLLLRLAFACESGFDVVGEAEDGRQAVDLTEELQPDVVVLDLSMPVMDGLEAIPELLRVRPGVRIVVLSGFDQARMKQPALELGAHDYLEKGAATSELVGAIRRLFPQHHVAEPIGVPDDPADPGGLAFDGDMVVHELRTPLTVITGMLTTLRERMDVLPSATTSEVVGAALRNARQMADLLDLVSDARHASHGQLPVLPEPVDVGRLVRTAVQDLSDAHGWQRIEVQAPDGLIAAVDATRLRQVLANLLSNAYRFSPPAEPVSVTVAAAGDSVEIAVADRGLGVPAQRRDELFGKFARLGQPGPGMGLGLYISRAIARAHGGDLELTPGPGARFTMRLPLHTGAGVRA